MYTVFFNEKAMRSIQEIFTCPCPCFTQGFGTDWWEKARKKSQVTLCQYKMNIKQC